MLFAAAKRELSANGTAASQYRDGTRPVRIDLPPAEPILTAPSPRAAISVFVKIHKQ